MPFPTMNQERKRLKMAHKTLTSLT